MTGFARHSGTHETLRWTWELRSVNGKGLDIRLRLPPGFEHLEPAVRKAVGKSLSRGNVQISLTLERQVDASALKVNEAALASVVEAAGRIDAEIETALSSAAQLLAIRGVLESVEPFESRRGQKTPPVQH